MMQPFEIRSIIFILPFHLVLKNCGIINLPFQLILSYVVNFVLFESKVYLNRAFVSFVQRCVAMVDVAHYPLSHDLCAMQPSS